MNDAAGSIKLLEEVLAVAGVGYWTSHADGSGFRAATSLRQLLGYSTQSLADDLSCWLALVHPVDRPALSTHFAPPPGSPLTGPLTGQIRLRHICGLWHWFDIRSRHRENAEAPWLITFNEITEQKQAEAALRDSQLRYRTLYNTTPLGFVVWDRQGRISEWNRRAEEIFGWTTEEVIGKAVHRLLLPETSHSRFATSVRALLQAGANGEYTGPALTRDGALRECQWHNVALRTASGKLTGILSLIADVTADHQARLNLEHSEKRHRTLVETSPDAILLIGLDGQLQIANRQAHRLFRIDDLLELSSISINQLLPALPATEPVGFLEKAEEYAGFIVNQELTMQSLDGHLFEARTAFTTIADAEEQISGVVLFIRDITEQRKRDTELQRSRQELEQRVQERTQELQTAHEILDRIIDGSTVPMFVLSPDHVITHWNRACEEITGVPASQMLGTQNQWQAFYPEVRPVLADLVLNGEIDNLDQPYKHKVHPSSIVEDAFEGDDYFPMLDRWLFFTAAPLRDSQNRILGAIETLQDISTRKRAEHALIEAKQHAEAAAEAKASFLANMSHEIRTPMNAVLGLAHLLLQSTLTGKQQDQVTRIQSAGQMLLRLINDILDYSKIEAGQMQIEQTEFSLDEVLENVASIVRQRAQEKGLEMHFVVSPDTPAQLIGDPLRLAQILINLTGNAVKFTAKGSVTLYFRTHPLNDDRLWLEIDVQDSGIGISAEQQAKLFQPFSQADSSTTRKFGGTGLGLSICQRLVELMGGRIWVNSTPGQGSTFSFNLLVGRTIELASPASSQATRRALVVDDNRLARAVVAGLFEKAGYLGITAESGRQALEILNARQSAPFEIVAIDLNMPDMDGLELAQLIRNQIIPTPRLVMVTASDTQQLELDDRLNSFEAVIHKPVTAAQITKVATGETRKPRQDKPPARLAGLRILLVDDLPTNQMIASEMLESEGATVDTADNGWLALQKITTNPLRYDVVLMDVQMPVMDGLEATRQLRGNDRLRQIPVIAMTAHALDSEHQRCLGAGMNDFITKPIDPEFLIATLQRWRPPQQETTPATSATAQTGAPAPISEGMPELPGINQAAGLRQMMNKISLYQRVLRDFHARFQNETAQIQSALLAGDFDVVKRRVHSAKGLAATIGAHELQEAARRLEQALIGTSDAAESALIDFDQALKKVIDGIDAAFAISRSTSTKH